MKKVLFLPVLIFMTAAFVCGQGFGFDSFDSFGFGDMGGMPAVNSKAKDRADDAQDKLEGRIALRFFDAITRQPLSGATVVIPNAGSFTTNNQGKIVFPKIADGSYTLTFSKSGYITTPVEFKVLLGAVDFNWYNISKEVPLPPKPPTPAPPSNYRIILEWGQRPVDLDLHFVKTGGSGDYHISYLNMKKADDGNAVLDRDDMAGYGPETITIGRMDNNASYVCYVHDYTDRNDTESTLMAQNGATIRVYSDNSLVKTIRIPSGAKGTRWDVFKIDKGVLTEVNKVIAR